MLIGSLRVFGTDGSWCQSLGMFSSVYFVVIINTNQEIKKKDNYNQKFNPN